MSYKHADWVYKEKKNIKIFFLYKGKYSFYKKFYIKQFFILNRLSLILAIRLYY